MLLGLFLSGEVVVFLFWRLQVLSLVLICDGSVRDFVIVFENTCFLLVEDRSFNIHLLLLLLLLLHPFVLLKLIRLLFLNKF